MKGLNSSIPFRVVNISENSPFKLESDVQADAFEDFENDAAELAFDVTFSFAVSLGSVIKLGCNLIHQLRLAVANICAGYSDEVLGTTIQGSGRLDYFIPFKYPIDKGNAAVPMGNETTSNNKKPGLLETMHIRRGSDARARHLTFSPRFLQAMELQCLQRKGQVQK